MTEQSLLAAVRAAASELPSASAEGQQEEPDMAAPEKTADTSAETKPTTVAELAAAFPDLCAALRSEGATAERARILGIEAMAMAGHDQLIAELKADGKTTPDQAAARIIGAQKETRRAQLSAIQAVETETGQVRPALASMQEHAEPASTPDAWRAEFDRSATLQQEFGTADRYVAYQRGVAEGRIRILRQKTA